MYDNLYDIIDSGCADVKCSNCTYETRIEPDGDYGCPECNKGRITSPLIELGMI